MGVGDEVERYRAQQTELDREDLGKVADAVCPESLKPNDFAVYLGKVMAALTKHREVCSDFDEAGYDLQDQALHISGLLQGIAYDLGPLLSHVISSAAGNGGERRALFDGCVLALNTLAPQTWAGDDLVLVPMPARVALAVKDGLRSLVAGEVPPIFSPTTGRHGAAYTWDEARQRAVEHVAFLCGKGCKKNVARELVAKAMGVSVETLRDWECRVERRRIDNAQEAGEIAFNMENGFTTERADVFVVKILQDLRAEPLSEFADRYKKVAGTRHWGGGN